MAPNAAVRSKIVLLSAQWTPQVPDLITDLAEVRQRAATQRARFDLLRLLLERRAKLDDAKLDAFVEQVAAPIVSAIDCTQCANCCRSLDVYLVEDDARRLADGLLIPLD